MKGFSILISLFTASAFAQTGALPPVQPPAGNPGKFQKPGATKQPVAGDTSTQGTAPTNPAGKTATDKRAARKARRAEKVGDKPLD